MRSNTISIYGHIHLLHGNVRDFQCSCLHGGNVLLADKFGAAYEQYRNSVPRWIPRLKPHKEDDSGS